jgi:hypothetical protein
MRRPAKEIRHDFIALALMSIAGEIPPGSDEANS